MLNSLGFSNFKSWSGTTQVEMRGITGLFGTNSSGKSSILQTLLLLKQTAESLDRSRVLHLGDDRSLVDLGTYYEVISRHDRGLALEFEVKWTAPTAIEVRDPERKDAVILDSQDLSFSVTIKQDGEGEAARLVVDEFEYSLGQWKFGMRRRAEEEDLRYDVMWTGYQLKRRRGRPWPLPPPLKSYGFPDQVANYFQNADFVDDLSLALEELLTSISYVGPLREYPHRSYVWGGERPSSVGVRGE
jgi:AAA ATPase domain